MPKVTFATVLCESLPDGSLNVHIPSPDWYGVEQSDFKNALIQKGVLLVDAQTFFTTTGKMPKDRDFREAWASLEPGKVAVPLNRAKAVHMKRVREKRDALLRVKDAEFLVALSRGDQEGQQAVENEKQVLRDVPQNIDLSKALTPEDLKTIWPEPLGLNPYE